MTADQGSSVQNQNHDHNLMSSFHRNLAQGPTSAALLRSVYTRVSFIPLPFFYYYVNLKQLSRISFPNFCVLRVLHIEFSLDLSMSFADYDKCKDKDRL